MKKLKLVLLTVLEFLEFGWQVVVYALLVVSAFFRQRASMYDADGITQRGRRNHLHESRLLVTEKKDCKRGANKDYFSSQNKPTIISDRNLLHGRGGASDEPIDISGSRWFSGPER
jgi:hypothetical protein